MGERPAPLHLRITSELIAGWFDRDSARLGVAALAADLETEERTFDEAAEQLGLIYGAGFQAGANELAARLVTWASENEVPLDVLVHRDPAASRESAERPE